MTVALLPRVRLRDRAAFRALLEDHGAAVDEVVRQLGDDGDAQRTAVAHALWLESALMLQPPPDERGVVIAAAAVQCVLPTLAGGFVDALLAARLSSKVAVEIASAADVRVLGELRRVQPTLDDVVAAVRAAVPAARAATGGGRTAALWPAIAELCG
jgi:hypothetical protein